MTYFKINKMKMLIIQIKMIIKNHLIITFIKVKIKIILVKISIMIELFNQIMILVVCYIMLIIKILHQTKDILNSYLIIYFKQE